MVSEKIDAMKADFKRDPMDGWMAEGVGFWVATFGGIAATTVALITGSGWFSLLVGFLGWMLTFLGGFILVIIVFGLVALFN